MGYLVVNKTEMVPAHLEPVGRGKNRNQMSTQITYIITKCVGRGEDHSRGSSTNNGPEAGQSMA